MSLEVLSEKKATFRIREELFWAMKRLAVDKKTNVTTLLNQAIEDYLSKNKAAKK